MHSRIQWIALLLFLSLTGTSRAQAKLKDSPYYPLQVGCRWTYRLDDRKYVQTVTKHELLGGALWPLVESESSGKVKSREHIAPAADGVYRRSFGAMIPIPAETPVCILRLPAKKGETWTVDTKIAGQRVQGTYILGEDEITVPAGKFKTLTVTTNDTMIGNQKTTGTAWYAAGVGKVREIINYGGTEVVLELEKFEPGKP